MHRTVPCVAEKTTTMSKSFFLTDLASLGISVGAHHVIFLTAVMSRFACPRFRSASLASFSAVSSSGFPRGQKRTLGCAIFPSHSLRATLPVTSPFERRLSTVLISERLQVSLTTDLIFPSDESLIMSRRFWRVPDLEAWTDPMVERRRAVVSWTGSRLYPSITALPPRRKDLTHCSRVVPFTTKSMAQSTPYPPV